MLSMKGAGFASSHAVGQILDRQEMVMSPMAVGAHGGPVRRLVQVHTPVARGFRSHGSSGHRTASARLSSVPGQTLAMSSALLSDMGL